MTYSRDGIEVGRRRCSFADSRSMRHAVHVLSESWRLLWQSIAGLLCTQCVEAFDVFFEELHRSLLLVVVKVLPNQLVRGDVHRSGELRRSRKV